jgi:hypothetical protein
MKTLTFAASVLLVPVRAGLSACARTRQVSSGNTDQCLNVEWHGYSVAGTPLRVKPCDPWRNQQWFFNKDVAITGVGDFSVDVQGSEVAEGTAVVYVPCTGRPSQKWTVSGTQLVVSRGPWRRWLLPPATTRRFNSGFCIESGLLQTTSPITRDKS